MCIDRINWKLITIKNLMKNILSWVLKLVAVGVVLMTVFVYKFPAHEESIALFSKISSELLNGVLEENILRLGTGVIELLASILFLIPMTERFGALAFLGVMGGAIMSHVLVLGYDQVFFMALLVSACSGLFLLLKSNKIA